MQIIRNPRETQLPSPFGLMRTMMGYGQPPSAAQEILLIQLMSIDATLARIYILFIGQRRQRNPVIEMLLSVVIEINVSGAWLDLMQNR